MTVFKRDDSECPECGHDLDDDHDRDGYCEVCDCKVKR